MQYTNPILSGFYPDPSVCQADGKFYLACSSFQYFPGVPLFESSDLVNWKQIGHALTRKSQIMLEKVPSSGGVFAPTLRFHDGRFYMVTNNNSTQENFYIYTDDIYGEWSEAITVDQGGIDPSLLFDGEHAYFISNGQDEHGLNCVMQCEIDIATGNKLTPSKPIWHGSGGRYLESPHMYHIDGCYYLVAAEGGTEYGHMVTYAKADNPWGPFADYPHNPVLTNRNKAPNIIQGIGHGDLICNTQGDWFILTLGFRQIHEWQPYHHLGREVFLTPVSFREDGWFTAGADGTTDESYEIAGDFAQIRKKSYTFDNTPWDMDWVYLRHPHTENYIKEAHCLMLRGTDTTLDDADSPTFLGIRQKEFNMTVSVDVDLLTSTDNDNQNNSDNPINSGTALNFEAGLTLYMDELQHYDICVTKFHDGYRAVLKLNIGGVRHTQASIPLPDGQARLSVEADNLEYHFYLLSGENYESKTKLGTAYTKYLSSEVAGGFTGTMIGLYAVGTCKSLALFTEFNCTYHD